MIFFYKRSSFVLSFSSTKRFVWYRISNGSHQEIFFVLNAFLHIIVKKTFSIEQLDLLHLFNATFLQISKQKNNSNTAFPKSPEISLGYIRGRCSLTYRWACLYFFFPIKDHLIYSFASHSFQVFSPSSAAIYSILQRFSLKK